MQATSTASTRKAYSTAPYLTPYLGLQARLSQLWINRWTVLLFLVLARVLLGISGLHSDINSAQREALSACTGVESMGSAMASMPHYMSKGVNEMAAKGVEKAVNGLMETLLLSVTGSEELLVFVVNLMTSTYVCLITLVISGSLHAAVELVDDVSKFLNQTLGGIGDDIGRTAQSFEHDLNKFTSALNGVPAIFGSKAAIPSLNIDDDLSRLHNLVLPASLTKELHALNSSIPDFAQVNNFTNHALQLPFEEIKKLINSTFVAYKFDRSVFPVPQKERLTFCTDNRAIGDFFGGLHDLADMAQKIFTAVLIILAVLAVVPMALREVRRWRTMQSRAKLLEQHSFDPMDVVTIASRPYTSTAGIWVASKFKSSRRQILVRWFFAYVTSTPALFVLSLAIAGLFSCLCQIVLLRSLQKEVPALAHEVGQFGGLVVQKLNNASEQWAVGANRAIISVNDEINHEVLGWVNTSTTAVNDTLNVFVDEMRLALNVTFGGTPLYGPVQGVLDCLIGLKIAGIQKGLTWVSQHAHVNFPLFDKETFSLGAAASIVDDSNHASDSFLTNPTSKATDQVTGALVALTDKLAGAIRQEALISTCVLLVWVLIVLIGLGRTVFLWFGRDKIRGEGGPGVVGLGNGEGKDGVEMSDRSRSPEWNTRGVGVANEKGFEAWEDEGRRTRPQSQFTEFGGYGRKV